MIGQSDFLSLHLNILLQNSFFSIFNNYSTSILSSSYDK
jgi:hypothetical protein